MRLFNEFLLPPFYLPDSEEYNVQEDKTQGLFKIKVPYGELLYWPRILSDQLAESVFEDLLLREINWEHKEIKMFGRKVLEPRHTALYGEKGLSYLYSGKRMQTREWSKGLLYLKQLIEEKSKHHFNTVLLNHYRHGKDYMGYHADDEKELGENPVIASLSLGAERRFLLRLNEDKDQKIEFKLAAGDLLLMRGGIQEYWKHSIPKMLKVKTGRINLTFRKIFIHDD